MNMNIEKLFGSFDEENDPEESLKWIEDLKNTPSYKIGMFKKLIQNASLDGVITKVVGKVEGLSEEEVSNIGEWITFNSAWSYIEECNLEEEMWIDSIKIMGDEYFLVSLQLGIKFFELIEDYEKCAFLKKIEVFFKNNLEP